MGFFRENRFFCGLLTAWLLFFCLLRMLQHFSFATNALDLSLFDYAISSVLQGQALAEPFHGYGWSSFLAIHFTPALFLLAPFYLIWQGPLFLLHFQVLSVGLAAVPLYLLAREELGGKRPALIIAVSYLLFRPLITGMMYDFHPEMLFPLLIFSGHYFLTVKKNNFLFFLFILLALFIKEDFAIYVFFYCLWLLHAAELRKTALKAAFLSAIYAGLAFTLFIPHFRQQIHASSAYEFLSQWKSYGDNFWQIAGHGLLHPIRFLHDVRWLPNLPFLANYFLPLMLIPLLDPAILLILPPLVIGWLSRIPLMSSFGLYYGSAIIPFLFLALLRALAKLRRRKGKDAAREKAKWAWGLNLLLILSLVNFKWNLLSPAKYHNLRFYPAVRDCLKSIPAQAALAAQSALIPHVSKRRAITVLPETAGAEYILFHMEMNPWPMARGRLRALDERLQSSPDYRCLCRTGALRLYRKTTI